MGGSPGVGDGAAGPQLCGSAQVPWGPKVSHSHAALIEEGEWEVLDWGRSFTAVKGSHVKYELVPHLPFYLFNYSPQQKLPICRCAAILREGMNYSFVSEFHGSVRAWPAHLLCWSKLHHTLALQAAITTVPSTAVVGPLVPPIQMSPTK